MSESPALATGAHFRLERSDFSRFLERIRACGYRVVGPTVRDGAIVYGDIERESDLPIGWTDRQEAGRYRLERRSDAALFGYAVGPHSWKKYLFPARERLWQAHRAGDSFRVEPEPEDARPLAFLGVRACELAAIAIQDRVFERAGDPSYRARRRGALRIAVQCGTAAATCFCASMGTGPAVGPDQDLALTEILDGPDHYFDGLVGSPAGAEVLRDVPTGPAGPREQAAAAAVLERTTASMGRRVATVGLRDLLVGSPEHPRWREVGSRCLACSNCTLACPTCFCQSTEEVPDLSGDRVERWRHWDSCFTPGFTELRGQPLRASTPARYRQWLTHKFGTWHDQFGSSGCVGCGRCITWCPVGIDVTEELAALRVPANRGGPA